MNKPTRMRTAHLLVLAVVAAAILPGCKGPLDDRPYLRTADREWLTANPDPRIRYIPYDWRLNR